MTTCMKDSTFQKVNLLQFSEATEHPLIPAFQVLFSYRTSGQYVLHFSKVALMIRFGRT